MILLAIGVIHITNGYYLTIINISFLENIQIKEDGTKFYFVNFTINV